MSRAVNPSYSPASASRHSKVESQRLYREKEGECFNALRDIINELTGEELQTRQEILRKAIYLLTTSETKKLREANVVHPAPYNPSTEQYAATPVCIGHSHELPEWSHGQWQQPAVGFDTEVAYHHVPQSHSQQPHLSFNPDYQAGYWAYPS